MSGRRITAAVAALAMVLVSGGTATADVTQPQTDVAQVRVPIAFVDGAGRPLTGEALIQRNNMTGSAIAGFFWVWRNPVECDNGTPEPEDDFIGEELVDFTADSIVPSSFMLASNLASSSATLTGTGQRIHMDGCTGVLLENATETHTFSYSVAATGPARRSTTRERIPNEDGTVTTIVVREIHREAAGTSTLDAATLSVAGADLATITITETTR